jgi:hypothetical protein
MQNPINQPNLSKTLEGHFERAADNIIRIDLGREAAPGVFTYSVVSLGLSGKSRQPLLDACRQIKRALGPTKAEQEHAGLYRPGRTHPDIFCAVLVGAGVTVAEPNLAKIHFAKFQEFNRPATRPDRIDDARAFEQEAQR